MNREKILNQLTEDYSMSAGTVALIDNILRFVEENYTDEGEQHKVLGKLLFGMEDLPD